MAMKTWPGAGQQYGMPQLLGVAGGSSIEATLNAANQAVHNVGYLFIEGGGTKTISSAGGQIRFMSGTATNTLANAGTTIRVGIQDVSSATSPSQGDGTFDVHGDMVGGTFSISDAAPNTVTMSSGSKSLTHGDKIAVVLKVISRAGVDVVRVRPHTNSGASTAIPKQFPGVTSESATAVFTALAGSPIITIIFDDGTRGFIFGGIPIGTTTQYQNTQAFNSGSTPDEYAALFRVNAPTRINGLWAYLLFANTSADCELILYRDALTSPVVVATVTVDATQMAQPTGSRQFDALLATEVDLVPAIYYAVAVRPTTANSVTISYWDFASGADMQGMTHGEDMFYGTRTNQTGAFTPTTTRRIFAGVFISGSEDGAPRPTFAIGGLP